MIGRVLGLLGLVLLAACAETVLQSEDSAGISGVSLVGVRYQSVWEGATAVAGGWQVAGNAGWVVTLTSGWITNYTASLVACSDVMAKRSSLFPQAFAGHSASEDPSAQISPYVEALMQDSVIDTVWFGTEQYCRFHWAMGAAGSDARGLENAPSALGHSLYLEGVATGPAGQEVALRVESMDVQALLVDIEPAAEGPFLATVVLRHDLSHLFEGVDLESEELGWEVLSALKDGTSVEVTLEPSEAVVDSGHLHE